MGEKVWINFITALIVEEFLERIFVNAPVNILGTKLKGKIMKIGKDEVKVIHVNAETKEKYIKSYSIEKLKKVL